MDGAPWERDTAVPLPVGVVLAGGRSARMGRDKAGLPAPDLEFPTLLARQVSLLSNMGLSEVLISLGPGHPEPDLPARVLRDEFEDQGPLGGIVAAMRSVPTRHLVVLAVDMGLVTPTLLQSLVSMIRPGKGVVPRVGDRWEPLCAIYPPRVLRRAEAVLESARPAPTSLVDALADAGLVRGFQVPPGDGPRFRSWNHPTELPEAIRYKLEREPGAEY